MAAGLISVEEFAAAAQQLVQNSTQIGDNWEKQSLTISGEPVIYLQKKMLIPFPECTLTSVRDTSETINEKSDDIEEEFTEKETDEDASELRSEASNSTTTWEYHVIYSSSYSVPVLYFNAYWPDGSTVGLDDVWRCVPNHYRDRLQADRWSFITQQEHPILRRAFYQLHPCHTADLMAAVTERPAKEFTTPQPYQYLLSWLSAVGPVVQLKMSLEYAKHLHEHSGYS